MKKLINLLSIGTLLLCLAVSFSAYAQPANDDCANAMDISSLFDGACNVSNLSMVIDNTGATGSPTDPPEPGESPNCPQTDDANLFGDDSNTMETSIWFTFTVPDLNGDGSPVEYSLWTSDGTYGDCGITNPLAGDADTQVAIYETSTCPDNTLGECDYFAANEDLFTSPPWISGWLSLSFTPGQTYYLLVDTWDGVEGEFCLSVTPCGTLCGDAACAPVETYCDCVDCQTECLFGNIAAIEFVEDDPATPDDESGFFFADDFEGNIFFCPEFVSGEINDNVLLGFGGLNFTDCAGGGGLITVTLSNGTLTGVAPNPDGSYNMPTGNLFYIELTPADIAAGSITITGSAPDGIGNTCTETITINFADFPQVSDPYCVLSCFAGSISDPAIITQNGCPEQTIEVCTDGNEDLSLTCPPGFTYQYAWRVLGIVYGTENVLTNWVFAGPCTSLNVDDFFIDEFGYAPPYFTPGLALIPGTYTVEAAALCVDAAGNIDSGCFADGEITITILEVDDPLCSAVMGCTDPCSDNYDPAATEDNGSCNPQLLGCMDAAACNFDPAALCDDPANPCDLGNAACADPCNPVMGCTDATACNFDANACVDDGNCDPGNQACADPCNPISGCTNPDACNFDAAACVDDGNCDLTAGCTDPAACNYNAAACVDDSSCDLGNTACPDPCNEPNADDGCDLTTDTFDAATCTVTNEPNCAANEVFNAASCECVIDMVDGCTDPCDPAFDPASTNDVLCVGYSTDCNADCTAGPFGGIWDAATCGCINEVAPVNGCIDDTACNYDPAANCDDSSCDFGNTACADPCNEPNPDDGCDVTTDTFDAATCTITNEPNCAANEVFNAASCECVVDMVDGCTDPCDPAFDPASTNDVLCVGYSTDCNADCTAGPFGGIWDAATCGCINETTPALGCTDSMATNYDPAANCDDGTCVAGCPAEAATISGGPFQFCAGDGVPDFVSGITVSNGAGTNSAWVITDDALNILALPGMPGEVDFDGAGFGICLIWYVTFEDIAGAEVGMNAADLTGCFALSNSIEVDRQDCTCEDEISGSIEAGMDCDVSGTAVLITDAAGNPVGMAIADANGDYVLSGVYECGEYIATIDVASAAACYIDAGGDVGPSGFTVNGDGTADGANFSAFEEVPTLSQWGLMTLALLLMTFGALKLGFVNNLQTQLKRKK